MVEQIDLVDQIDEFLKRGQRARAEVDAIIGKSDREARRRPRARKTDPQTSHTAAKRVSENIRRSQQAVLECFNVGRGDGFALRSHMTDPEFISVYRSEWARFGWPKQSDSGLRTRRHELVVMGKLEAVGKWKGESGREFTVWALKRETP